MRVPSPLLILVAVSACRSSPSGSSTSGDAEAAISVTSSPEGGAVTGGHAMEAQVKQLLDEWLASQNASAFERYEALYGARFEGVRRSGTQTARLDRKRWMKERAAMFKQKMIVAIKDVSISAKTSDGARVQFIQTWSSGDYRDEGPKQIVVVRQGKELKISREEMMWSVVTPPGKIPLEKFAFALSAGHAEQALALHASPTEAWTRGAPKMSSMAGVVTTKKDVDEGKLPAEMLAWKGKKVEMFSPSGVVCEGTIRDFAMLSRVTPHFGTVARWTGTGDFQGEPKPPAAEVAKEAWGMGALVLIGQVKQETGDCAKAIWGRGAATEKMLAAAATKTDPTTKNAMLAEMRRSKPYQDLQSTYLREKEPKDPPRWEDFQSTVTALEMDHPSGTKIVTLSITAGPGCGAFGGTLSQAWTMQKDGRLSSIQDPSGDELSPSSAADVDGDGQLDLLFQEAIMHAKPSGKLESRQKLEVPFLDCGC